MATRIEPADPRVIIPAGATKANPTVVDLSFAPGVVEWFDIVIPSGHNGFTGIALGHNGNRVYPRTGYLTANDHVFHWVLESRINSGSWQAFGYNTDGFQHSFYVYIGVLDPERLPPPGLEPPTPIEEIPPLEPPLVEVPLPGEESPPPPEPPERPGAPRVPAPPVVVF